MRCTVKRWILGDVHGPRREEKVVARFKEDRDEPYREFLGSMLPSSKLDRPADRDQKITTPSLKKKKTTKTLSCPGVAGLEKDQELDFYGATLIGEAVERNVLRDATRRLRPAGLREKGEKQTISTGRQAVCREGSRIVQKTRHPKVRWTWRESQGWCERSA